MITSELLPVAVVRGGSPIILGLPHTGMWIPAEVAMRLNPRGRMLTDTDWHVDHLYDGLLPDATTVRATFHRYVIDPNRPPDGASLYPGQHTTGLVPLTDFDGQPLWTNPPGAAEVEVRLRVFHERYHAALTAEVERVRAIHGVAILFDCHSIRSRIPSLFDGTLPDLNIGTADGRSCAPQLQATILRSCSNSEDYRHVLNGRFKGGWTTRHYGRPSEGTHAIQLELAQSTYLNSESPPFAYDHSKAARLRPVLTEILNQLAALAPELSR